jgi:hypothetical protein
MHVADRQIKGAKAAWYSSCHTGVAAKSAWSEHAVKKGTATPQLKHTMYRGSA